MLSPHFCLQHSDNSLLCINPVRSGVYQILHKCVGHNSVVISSLELLCMTQSCSHQEYLKLRNTSYDKI